MKEFNRKGKLFHGYNLGVTGAAKNNQRTYGMFEPYMISKKSKVCPSNPDLTPPEHPPTTLEELEMNKKIILELSYLNSNVGNSAIDTHVQTCVGKQYNQSNSVNHSNLGAGLNCRPFFQNNSVQLNVGGNNIIDWSAINIEEDDTEYLEKEMNLIEDITPDLPDNYQIPLQTVLEQPSTPYLTNEINSSESTPGSDSSHTPEPDKHDQITRAIAVNDQRNLQEKRKQDEQIHKDLIEKEHTSYQCVLKNTIDSIKKNQKKTEHKKHKANNSDSIVETNSIEDSQYYPECFIELQFNTNMQKWKVEIKWCNYSSKETTWEDAITFIYDDDFHELVADLLKTKRWKSIPNLKNNPRKRLNADSCNKMQKPAKLKLKTCTKIREHSDRVLRNRIEGLKPEDNNRYVNEGEKFHGMICQKCKKTFVRNITSPTHVTIKTKEPAWHCPQISFGCGYVWCNKCYTNVLVG